MFPFWSECHDDGELEEGNLITGYGQLVLLGPMVEYGKVSIHRPAETTTAIRLQSTATAGWATAVDTDFITATVAGVGVGFDKGTCKL